VPKRRHRHGRLNPKVTLILNKDGSPRGYQGDFRRWRAYLNGRSPRPMLYAPGESTPTINEDVARVLWLEQARAYEAMSHGKHVAGISELSPAEFFAGAVRRKFRGGKGRKSYAPGTIANYTAGVRVLLATRAIGSLKSISQLSPHVVAAVISELEGRVHQLTGEPVSVHAVRGWLVTLSDLCQRAVFDGHLGANPVHKHPDFPRVEVIEKPWLDHHQLGDLLAHVRGMPGSASNPFAYYQIALMAYLGLRRAEALGARPEDLDLDNAVFRVRHNRWAKKPHVVLRRVKNAAAVREIPMPHALVAIMREFVDRFSPAGELLFDLGRVYGPRDLVSKTGDRKLPDDYLGAPKPMTSVLGTLRTAFAALGFGRPGHHVLRHSATALLVQMVEGDGPNPAPISLFTVMRYIGHSSLRQIAERYGHLSRSRLRVRFEDLDLAGHSTVAVVDGGPTLVQDMEAQGITLAVDPAGTDD
jgi:integrase